jgi:protoporphyrinogen oxidase
MEAKKPTVHIIGAGISGLVAAMVLEKQGIAPVIIEASDRPGGRVKTDIVAGFQLDHGFQVLLTQYPAAQKYLDYKALQLQEFKAGACVFMKGKPRFFGDPLRDFGVLFSTLFSGVGTLVDKVKIFQLNLKLKKKSIQAIFETQEQTTLAYLKDFGFSDKVIEAFFRPFFSGIFLETELATSSRMFEFVFKLFGEGMAALPKGGIEAIAQQLTQNLQHTTFHFNTKVDTIKDAIILLQNGEQMAYNYAIIATEAHGLVENIPSKPVTWKACQTLYFTTPSRLYQAPFIGLITNKNSLINNIFYHNSLPTTQQGTGELLSVTVVKEHQLSEEALIAQVMQELQAECGIEQLSFLKLYHIPKALPQLHDLQYDLSTEATQWTNRICLAGDVQLNGSLNAAMLAGERAAERVGELIQQQTSV